MECPSCGCLLNRVVRTRPITLRYRDGRTVVIRQRRRECEHCGTRFTTQERSIQAAEPAPDP
jgi:YgiT-type zinc finger domain-containing protein